MTNIKRIGYIINRIDIKVKSLDKKNWRSRVSGQYKK